MPAPSRTVTLQNYQTLAHGNWLPRFSVFCLFGQIDCDERTPHKVWPPITKQKCRGAFFIRAAGAYKDIDIDGYGFKCVFVSNLITLWQYFIYNSKVSVIRKQNTKAWPGKKKHPIYCFDKGVYRLLKTSWSSGFQNSYGLQQGLQKGNIAGESFPDLPFSKSGFWFIVRSPRATHTHTLIGSYDLSVVYWGIGEPDPTGRK